MTDSANNAASALNLETVYEALRSRQEPLAQLEKAQAAVDRANHLVGEAVRNFNAKRLQLIVDAIIAQGNGWCSHGRHLAPESELFGIITNSSYVTSGYYNYARAETSYGTACRDHLAGATRSSWRSEDEWSNSSVSPLDVRQVWVAMIPRLLNNSLRSYVESLNLPAEIRENSGLPYGRYSHDGKPLVVEED